MSAAPADPSAPPVSDPLNSSRSPADGHPPPYANADQLEAKIEALIDLCQALDRKQREQQTSAARLTEDNAKLRQILQHTYQQIQELTDHIRMMEQ